MASMFDYLRFTSSSLDPSLIVYGAYEPWLVILSILVAIFASSVALETARHIRRAQSAQVRNILLLVGSFAMGGGVWSMHFIGMLAFQLCGGISYEPVTTLISMLPSVLASAVALRLLSQEHLGLRNMLEGGVLIGMGIGSMHYAGMAAMRISSQLYYDPWLFALSIVVAVGLSVAGIWIRFGLKQHLPGLTGSKVILAGGSVLGCAIAGMHYTGMAAAVFVGDPAQCPPGSLGDSTFLAVAIASVTVLIALLSLGLNVSIRQRELAAHLSRERRRQHAITDTAVDGIILIDDTGEILEYNPACENLFGYRRDEVLGENVAILMANPYRDQLDGYLAHYRRTGKRGIIGTSGREGLGRRKDGTTFPLDLSVGEFVDKEERLFIGVLRDITERKRMESDLRHAKEEAERAATSKTVFLANMSHEIRTPMNAILGFIELVLSNPLPEQQRKHLGTAHNSARSLLRLLNDILDSAKLEEQAVELEELPFSLDTLLDEIHSTLAITVRNKGLGLRVSRDPALPPCYLGDSTRLRQVLTNPAGNAVKFTDQGHIEIRVLRAPRGALRFEVEDTGIGIPENKLESIFQPFSQSDASVTRRYGGTGLGTSIVKQLVELMGGEVEVRSTPGIGSCFSFSVNLTPGDCPEVSEVQVSTGQTLGAILDILVVDDLAANAELLRLHLESADHRVAVAANGREALDLATSQSFDLILMDINMPEMDGLQASRAIREHAQQTGARPVPIIALTAGAFQQDRDAARAAGMDGFVTKPVEFEALYTEIRRVLDIGLLSQVETGKEHDEEFPVLPGIDTWRAPPARWRPHCGRTTAPHPDCRNCLPR